MSTKTPGKAQDRAERGQKHVRNQARAAPDSFSLDGLKINLGQLVGSLSGGGKVQAYTQIAADLSRLAGLNGNAWSWRYVASVHSGSVAPGKKFVRVLELLLEEISPRKKQWFYFAYYHEVAAVYARTVKREMITEHMKGLGYKMVSFTRYMELKTKAVRSKK